MNNAINKDCPCKKDCPRHGNCELCRENHKKLHSKTRCERIKEEEDEAALNAALTSLNTVLF